jgi:hypothetical protein
VGDNLGQHAMAVSLGSRASRKTSRYGGKNSETLFGTSPDTLSAPEILVDVGLSLVAAPTVAQPEGQTRPGD